MNQTAPTTQIKFPPLDYLLIGHITQDLSPAGAVLGGTAAYSARAAVAMGMRVGIVTVAPPSVDLSALSAFPIQRLDSPVATTFENIQTPAGRIQYLHQRARPIVAQDVPMEWRSTPIVHLGPVANEIDPSLLAIFPHSFLGITPQGCMRAVDENQKVKYRDWADAPNILAHCSAGVISVEDVKFDEGRINNLQKYCKVFVVTEGAGGARLFCKGDLRRVPAPTVKVLDTTGAGDVFAAIFFIRLQATGDPWLACTQAVHLASLSITRTGVEGVPTAAEVQNALMEITPQKG